MISQADTVTPAVEADDDRSSILSYSDEAASVTDTHFRPAASVTDTHFGPAANGGRWDLAGQFFNAAGVRQAGITKLFVLQCIIAEFGPPVLGHLETKSSALTKERSLQRSELAMRCPSPSPSAL